MLFFVCLGQRGRSSNRVRFRQWPRRAHLGADLDPLSQRGAPAFGFVGVNALRTPNGWVSVGQVRVPDPDCLPRRKSSRSAQCRLERHHPASRQCLRVQIIQVAVRLNNRRVELRDFSAAVLSH